MLETEDCFENKPASQTRVEYTYNEVYSSLEQIGKLINNDATPFCKIEESYSTCNAAIEVLLVEETYPAFIESLQQLQESLAVHMRLLRDKTTTASSSNSFSSQNTCTTDSNADNEPREEECNEEGDARCRAISATKKAPSCAGLHEIAGLTEAKQMLQEALILPAKYPQLFKGCCQPWSRVLLYGPPGTGKTRLAHAVAAEISADFYCISTADLLSSWVGESEKLIRELFNVPSSGSAKPIIFIDEIDSLCRRRSSSEAEHARRLKTELLIQIEDAAKRGIFLLCATNCPWELDPAFLRRFQRRIYVSTPDKEARESILQLHSGCVNVDWSVLVDCTEGYSGSDLATLTQYALLQPIRDLQHATCWTFQPDGSIIPCETDHPSAMQCLLKDLPPNLVSARDVDIKDFMKALLCTPPTIAKDDLQLFEHFTQQYGHRGS